MSVINVTANGSIDAPHHRLRRRYHIVTAIGDEWRNGEPRIVIYISRSLSQQFVVVSVLVATVYTIRHGLPWRQRR